MAAGADWPGEGLRDPSVGPPHPVDPMGPLQQKN